MYNSQNIHYVICLTGNGRYSKLLTRSGVNVSHLNISKNNFISFFNIFKIIRLFLDFKPSLVQSWMYHSDFITVIIKLISNVNIFWGLRHSNVLIGKTTNFTYYIIKILSRLSYSIPQKIISCSLNGIKVHACIGYDYYKMVYIPNGYNLISNSHTSSEILKFRSRIGITSFKNSITMVARYNPQKDHDNLLVSFAKLLQILPDTCCILAGPGMNDKNSTISTLLQYLNIQDKVFLIDEIQDVSLLFKSVDVSVLSSSFGEGFPNVVAESMLCSTPCVVTDIGDAPIVVNGCGWVVPHSNSDLLCKSIVDALNEKNDHSILWSERCLKSVEHIKENFSIHSTSQMFNVCWQEKNYEHTYEF